MSEEVKPIRITRVAEYNVTPYLTYCEEEGVKPDQDDFIEWLDKWITEDFIEGHYEETIEVIDSVRDYLKELEEKGEIE